MKKYIILLILILSVSSLHAQTDIFNWKLTAEGGSFVYEDHFGFPEDLKNVAFGLHIERTLNRSFSAGLSLFTGRPNGGQLKNTGYAALTLGFRWDNGWLLGERVFLAPYHTLEAGYLSGEKRSDGSMHHDFAAGTTHGLKFRLGDRLSARLGFGLYYPLDENQDRKWSDLMFYHQWKAGISYHFGARKIRYKGPVFNAGRLIAVQRETMVRPELSPLTEMDSLLQPIAQPKVIVEETMVLMAQDTLLAEPRIKILRDDSQLQIHVNEGENVIINISPQMFGKPSVIKKKEKVDNKEAGQAKAEAALEETETATTEEETTTTETGAIQEEVTVEILEEVTEETKANLIAETEEELTEEVSEEVAEKTAKETLQEAAEQTEEAEAVEAVEELEETEEGIETVVTEEEVEQEINLKETTEEAEEEILTEAEEELIEEISEEVAEKTAKEILQELSEQTEEAEAIEAVEELEETEEVTETVAIEEEVEEELVEVAEVNEKETTSEEAIEEQVVEEEQGRKQSETRVRTVRTPEAARIEEAYTEPKPAPTSTLPIAVPDSLEARYPIVLTFPFDSASLQEGHQEVLHQVAKDLEAHPDMLCKILGYADKSGDTIYNMILSGQRAEAIMECLAGFGIEPGRIIIEALGDRFASAEFSEEERKVEINIIPPPVPGEQP